MLPWLMVASAAILAGGCATGTAEPVPDQTVTVPADETAKDSPDQPASAGQETITIDPNVVSYDDYKDPLMPLNRVIFGFNDFVGKYALIPLGKGYVRFVPDAVDKRVDSFFDNVASPIYAINKLLQAEPKAAGTNLARFGINSTLGILGLFDPAKAWFGLEPDVTDFAETLGHYDVGYGTYLVLPFFGPSDLRNAAARGVDYFFNPVPYVLDNPESFIVLSAGFFDDFAHNAADYEKLLKQSDDPYIFTRNLHLQAIQRDAAYRK